LKMSAEGTALRRAILCRAFGTHPFFASHPGLTAGPIHCRPSGPPKQLRERQAE
jgi:hypothetical protein